MSITTLKNMNRIVDYTFIENMKMLGLFLQQAVGEESYIELFGDSVTYYAYTKKDDLMQTSTQLTAVDLGNIIDWDNSTKLAKLINSGTAETDYIIMDFGSIDERIITYHIYAVSKAYINVYVSDDNITYTQIDNITGSNNVISAKKESFRYLKLTYGNTDAYTGYYTYIYFIHVINTSNVTQSNSTNINNTNIVDRINIYNEKFCVVFDTNSYGKVAIYEIVVKDKIEVI